MMASIILDNVSVAYPVYNQRNLSLRANLVYYGTGGALARDAGGRVVVRALNQVSLTAERGDRVGLIGRNGAGKSTLLKVLAGIYKPTEGTLSVEGRVSAILGMGLGVDEELSGNDAIEYACLLRGIPRTDVKKLKEEIAAFTELGDYLELPIGTYSSGMRVRLAFAVATAYTPDILLLDEGIGAGDSFFLEKAKARANRFIGDANLLFLASHSDTMIRSMCNKAILLDHGHIVAAGAVNDVLEIYHDLEKPAANNVVVSVQQTGHARVTPLSSAYRVEHEPLKAFDGTATTFWHSLPGAEPFIGLQFDEPAVVQQITLRQWSNRLSGGPFALKVAIQCGDSDQLDEMETVATVDVETSIAAQRFGIPHVRAARFWRVVALELTDGGREGWGLTDLDFHSAPWSKFHFGQAISNGSASEKVLPDNAFKRQVPAPWVSHERHDEVEGVAWLGWDYGPNRKATVKRLRLMQWDEGARPNTIGRIKVQCSNDEFKSSVHTVANLDISQAAAISTYVVESQIRARYWRILADAPTDGGHWGISYIEFVEDI